MYLQIRDEVQNANAILIAVSKFQSIENILHLYNLGQRHFAENRVKDLIEKKAQLPSDIVWHLIGHLQSNKVKQLLPHVSFIHSVDSINLLQEINKIATTLDINMKVLLQVYISNDNTKYGFQPSEVLDFFSSDSFMEYKNLEIIGLMGMATNTDNTDLIKNEFQAIQLLLKQVNDMQKINLSHLSIGMSSDYQLALLYGATMVRIGSKVFNN